MMTGQNDLGGLYFTLAVLRAVTQLFRRIWRLGAPEFVSAISLGCRISPTAIHHPEVASCPRLAARQRVAVA